MKLTVPLALLSFFAVSAGAKDLSSFEVRAVGVPGKAGVEKFSLPQRHGEQEMIVLDPSVLLDHKSVESASTQAGPNGSTYIWLILNQAGEKRLADVTSQHVGKQIGFLLGGRLLTAPKIGEALSGRRIALTVEMSSDELLPLVNKLNDTIGAVKALPPTPTADTAPVVPQQGEWELFPPGRLPVGRVVTCKDVVNLEAGIYDKQPVYLTGDYSVTASGKRRSILRPDKDKTPIRVTVEHPIGIREPAVGQKLSLDESSALLIREIRSNRDGSITVSTRAVVLP